MKKTSRQSRETKQNKDEEGEEMRSKGQNRFNEQSRVPSTSAKQAAKALHKKVWMNDMPQQESRDRDLGMVVEVGGEAAQPSTGGTYKGARG